MKRFNKKDVEADESLALEALQEINNFYLKSFENIQTFLERHDMTSGCFSYLQKTYHFKKDMSQFNAFKLPENQVKFEKTIQERYGVSRPRQNEEINKKGTQTFLDGALSDPEYLEKRKSSRAAAIALMDFGQKVRNTRAKHLSEDPLFEEKANKKREQTTLKKYGVSNISQLEDCKNQKKQTLLDHYGTLENYEAARAFTRSNSCLSRYGVDHFSKTEDYAKKRSHKWVVENKKFDSKWEIYYYYYLLDNGIPFREQVPLEYSFDNATCVYFCDFQRLDNNSFVEIKNPACLTPDHTLKLLWKNRIKPENLKRQEEKLLAKNKCMKDNNVLILYDEEYFKELERSFLKNHPTLKILKGDRTRENS